MPLTIAGWGGSSGGRWRGLGLGLGLGGGTLDFPPSTNSSGGDSLGGNAGDPLPGSGGLPGLAAGAGLAGFESLLLVACARAICLSLCFCQLGLLSSPPVGLGRSEVMAGGLGTRYLGFLARDGEEEGGDRETTLSSSGNRS